MKFAATVIQPPTMLSENFSRKFRPQKKSTLLYLKLLLNSLDGAYADPTNRRRISDTLTCAERADNLAILLLLALSRLDAADLATHLYTFYLCQLSAAIQSVTNVITLYLGKATQYSSNHLGNGIWLPIGVEGTERQILDIDIHARLRQLVNGIYNNLCRATQTADFGNA